MTVPAAPATALVITILGVGTMMLLKGFDAVLVEPRLIRLPAIIGCWALLLLVPCDTEMVNCC